MDTGGSKKQIIENRIMIPRNFNVGKPSQLENKNPRHLVQKISPL